MTITTGDKIPALQVTTVSDGQIVSRTTEALFGGRHVVLFSVPGAFTPVCSERHLPGFIGQLDNFAAKGVDQVICLAVNDPFVLQAWGRSSGIDDRILMLADGSALFTRALGLELDLTAHGLGIRGQRFAMVVDDMRVVRLAVEPPNGFGVSSAEQVVAAL